jgi:ketosteroid isomerase-like protein
MRMLHKHQVLRAAVALIATVGFASCGRAAAPGENKAAADEVTTAWINAFETGEAAQIAVLYAEDAHSMPPGTGPISGRSEIESYWRQDIGTGGLTTKLTPNDSIAQGDLLHVDGTYEVLAKNEGAAFAKGQYQQLWRRIDGAWRVQHEIWRLDPSLERNMDTAKRLASVWTTAYNAGDAKSLTALYDDGAILSTRPGAGAVGKEGIGAFWTADFGDGKPATKLTLTDVYMAGELAHLEGEYEVTDKGEVTKGHYVQLWMQDANEWRIHRELWWQ